MAGPVPTWSANTYPGLASGMVKLIHFTDDLRVVGGRRRIATRTLDVLSKDLSVIERARALAARREALDYSNAELGRRYDVARSTVSNLLRVLRHIPEEVQDAIHEHNLSGRVTAVLASAYGLPDVLQEAMAASDDTLGPDELLQAAVDGAGSEQLRRELRKSIRQHTVALDDGHRFCFPRDYVFPDESDIVAAACIDCPIVVTQRHDGTHRRCPDADCRRAKATAWHGMRRPEDGEGSGAGRAFDAGLSPEERFVRERIEDMNGHERGDLVILLYELAVEFGPDYLLRIVSDALAQGAIQTAEFGTRQFAQMYREASKRVERILEEMFT